MLNYPRLPLFHDRSHRRVDMLTPGEAVHLLLCDRS